MLRAAVRRRRLRADPVQVRACVATASRCSRRATSARTSCSPRPRSGWPQCRSAASTTGGPTSSSVSTASTSRRSTPIAVGSLADGLSLRCLLRRPRLRRQWLFVALGRAAECRAVRLFGHGRVRSRFGGSVVRVHLARSFEELLWRGLILAGLALALGSFAALVASSRRLCRLACGHARPSVRRPPRHRASASAASSCSAASSPRCSRTRPTTSSSTGASRRARGAGVIAAALRAVTKRFGEAVALDRVDLEVEAGEVARPRSARTARARRPRSSILLGLRRPDEGARGALRTSIRGGAAPALAVGVTPQESGLPADAAGARDRRPRPGALPVRRPDG